MINGYANGNAVKPHNGKYIWKSLSWDVLIQRKYVLIYSYIITVHMEVTLLGRVDSEKVCVNSFLYHYSTYGSHTLRMC